MSKHIWEPGFLCGLWPLIRLAPGLRAFASLSLPRITSVQLTGALLGFEAAEEKTSCIGVGLSSGFNSKASFHLIAEPNTRAALHSAVSDQLTRNSFGKQACHSQEVRSIDHRVCNKGRQTGDECSCQDHVSQFRLTCRLLPVMLLPFLAVDATPIEDLHSVLTGGSLATAPQQPFPSGSANPRVLAESLLQV